MNIRISLYVFNVYFYREFKNATKAVNKVCNVCVEGHAAERAARKFSARLKAGDFKL